MTPEQIKGLWICLVIITSMVMICPAVLWVLPDRSVAKTS
jgi:hypothetical protein